MPCKTTDVKPIKRSFQVLPSTAAKFSQIARKHGLSQWAALDEAMELWIKRREKLAAINQKKAA
jgi:hypothetical protein